MASTASTVALLTASTVLLGLFLMGVFTGWFNISILDITGGVNTDVQIIRSSIAVEGIVVNDEEEVVYLRNVGKTDVIVTRLEIFDLEGGSLLAMLPSDSYVGNLLFLEVGESGNLTLPECPSCKGVAVKLRVWYIAEQLYNLENPLESVDEMSFLEHVLKIPPRDKSVACPPFSGSWFFIEFVDPVAYVSTGRIAWDEIRILSPLASEYSLVDVSVTVTELESPRRTRVGEGVVKTMTNEISLVDANARGLYIPVEIEIRAKTDWMLAPKVWIFGKGRNNVHVSDITLTWDEVRRVINGAVVGMAKPRGTSGLYEIRVYLEDCNGNTIAENTRIQRVFGDSNTFLVFVELPPVKLDQVYLVGTSVREVRT